MAVGLVGLGWLASPGAVPVYDGVGTPDEPYRHVGSSPAPTAARVTVPLRAGATEALRLQSPERGPQVLVDLAPGALAAAGSALTLTASPLAGDGDPPRGRFDGNVYRITATPGALLRPGTDQGFVFLRAAVMTTPDPVIVHRDSPTERWVEQPTTRVGRDNLSTPFRALGDYAVVRLPGSRPLGEGGLGTTRVLLLGGGLLLLLTLTVVVLRRPPAGSGDS